MEFEIFDWVLAIILLGVGVLLLTGHGDMIMGNGPSSVERKKLYDDAKMQRAFGVGFLLMGLANVLTIYVRNFAVSLGYLIFVILVIVAVAVYVKKCCRK